MKGRGRLFGQLYQVAGHLLLSEIGSDPPDLSQCQHDRLVELVLDVLATPEEWTAKRLRIKYRLAIAP